LKFKNRKKFKSNFFSELFVVYSNNYSIHKRKIVRKQKYRNTSNLYSYLRTLPILSW